MKRTKAWLQKIRQRKEKLEGEKEKVEGEEENLEGEEEMMEGEKEKVEGEEENLEGEEEKMEGEKEKVEGEEENLEGEEEMMEGEKEKVEGEKENMEEEQEAHHHLLLQDPGHLKGNRLKSSWLPCSHLGASLGFLTKTIDLHLLGRTRARNWTHLTARNLSPRPFIKSEHLKKPSD